MTPDKEKRLEKVAETIDDFDPDILWVLTELRASWKREYVRQTALTLAISHIHNHYEFPLAEKIIQEALALLEELK